MSFDSNLTFVDITHNSLKRAKKLLNTFSFGTIGED